jgi:hypothetical protein
MQIIFGPLLLYQPAYNRLAFLGGDPMKIHGLYRGREFEKRVA